MRQIPLTKNKFALVDDEDFYFLNQHKWCASFGSRDKKWYAVRYIRKAEREADPYLWNASQKIAMHRFLLRPPVGVVVDHLNDDSLDNRKSNLEIIEQSENMARVANWKRKC